MTNSRTGILALLLAAACASGGRTPGATTAALRLDRVVLYRNGVGYFERRGRVEGDTLRLKVRKDHVNDLLKSLAVIDRGTGRVVSVSLPLDPQAWHRAALEALRPGSGRLAEVLDALRGTRVSVETDRRSVQGRIVLVEQLQSAPPPMRRFVPEPPPAPPTEDHRLTLIDGERMHVVLLSEVRSLALEDGDVVMQLDRHLDASAGEGMFQQVEVSIRLAGEGGHDVAVTYVAPAPQWRPTYRLVLDDKAQGRALLQSWAVVDNTSGEGWNEIALSLTSGEPFAFRYDLHTPRDVERPDLSYSAADKHARVAVGERTLGADEAMEMQQEAGAMAAPAEVAAPMEADADDRTTGDARNARRAKKSVRAEASMAAPAAPPAPMARGGGFAGGAGGPALSLESMQASAAPKAQARRAAGLTRFDLGDRVTLPDASASMVALVNEPVDGEQAFLFRPGGSGEGYEFNPYRVVRFKNSTAFVLEPGPISVYAGGSFVGEGLSEAVGAGETATIPFAVEPSIVVRSKPADVAQGEVKSLRLVGGVLEVESFWRVATEWSASGAADQPAYSVIVRHPRLGGEYVLVEPAQGVEQLSDAYLVPIDVARGKREASVKVIEQTPRQYSVSLWDGEALKVLDLWLSSSKLDAGTRQRLQPIVDLRREIGRIDTEVAGLHQQQAQLDERAQETRASLKSIEKDKRAGELRRKLQQRLEEVTREAAAIGRKIVELQSARLEKKLAIEDKIADGISFGAGK
jgi:hypothetical protein